MLATITAALLVCQGTFQRVSLESNPVFGAMTQDWIAMMPAYGVTGFSVVAIKEGKVVLLDAYGDADPFASRKADIDTRYYIASITKTMTATAILQLAEQGKVDLDAPVQRYLPRFTLADAEFAKSITVRDLLCHRPGIGGGQVVFLDAYTGGITDDRYYEMLAASHPAKEVRYENTHFTLLGRVIEAVAGMPWQEYLAKHVFDPLGMDRTTARMSSLQGDTNFAPPLVIGPQGPQPAPYMKTDRTMHAAGGVLTSARDMARYLTAFLQGGELEGRRVLQPATVAEGFKAQSSTPPDGRIRQFAGYGYAWQVGKYRDHEGLATHGGGYTGYSATIALLPKEGDAMAVLVNTGGPGAGFATILMVDIFDRLLGYPVDQQLRDNYSRQASAFLEKRRSLKPLSPNPAFSGLLTLRTEAYVGTYESRLYGRLVVGLTGGYLTLAIDDLPQVLKSTGVDAFTMHDGPEEAGTPCRFVVDGGRCAAVEVTFDGVKMVFERR